MVGMMRGQVNESHGVGGGSRVWLAKNLDFTQDRAAFRRLSVLSMFLSEPRTCFGLCRFCAVISGKCGKRGICGGVESISYVLSIWTVGPNPSLSASPLIANT